MTAASGGRWRANKMSTLALGLMSGTSADGVTAAAGDFSGKHFTLIGTTSRAYAPETLALIRKGGALTASEVSRLDVLIGEEFADAANRLLKKFHLTASRVACIGSHGQTVYHGSSDAPKNTLQLGDPAVIAERTGIDVVSHFRQSDIAAGGEGAPLIPYFDHYFFGDGPVRAFQNIGGIGNVTIVGRGLAEPLAFDTGPGNCLMDAAVRLATSGAETHDHHGQRAKQGEIDMAAVAKMLEHPFFRRPPPKSTGLEHFGEKFLIEHFGDAVTTRTNDVLATLNYFTCITIQESFRNFVFPKHAVGEIVVSGGGAHNKTLMKKLECLFAPVAVVSSDKFGLPVQAKEPLAFAFFGWRAIQRKPNHAPGATGARRARVLGRVTPAR